MLCQSGILIGRPTCCVEVDVHTRQNGNGEHTPQHFLNSNPLSSHMSNNCLKLLTLCPCELIKMLNMFISSNSNTEYSSNALDFMSTSYV